MCADSPPPPPLAGSVNDAPVATNHTYEATEDILLEVAAEGGLLANATDVDGDSLTASLLTDAANGHAVVNADGSFTHLGAARFKGVDTFAYKVTDGSGGEAVAYAIINVGERPSS